MKQCKECGIEKPEEAFRLYHNKYRSNKCRDCKQKSDKAWLEKRKQNPPKPTSETKRCNHCHEVKPLSEFPHRTANYYHGTCKVCKKLIHQQERREQYQNDPTGRFYWPFENETGVLVKRCTHCHAEKPLSEFYTNSANNPQRLHGKCKECDKAIKKAGYEANPERHRETVRRYMRKHPDRVRARHSRWYAANREHRIQYHRKYHAIHRDQRIAYDRERHIRNAEQERLYRIAHRYEASEREQRRRARQRNAPVVENINRKAIIERDKWTCYLCGIICTPQNVTLDHVIPLYRGGSHSADNLRVACASCNARKGVRPLHDFLKIAYFS